MSIVVRQVIDYLDKVGKILSAKNSKPLTKNIDILPIRWYIEIKIM